MLNNSVTNDYIPSEKKLRYIVTDSWRQNEIGPKLFAGFLNKNGVVRSCFRWILNSCILAKMSKRKAPNQNPNSDFCDFLIGEFRSLFILITYVLFKITSRSWIQIILHFRARRIREECFTTNTQAQCIQVRKRVLIKDKNSYIFVAKIIKNVIYFKLPNRDIKNIVNYTRKICI